MQRIFKVNFMTGAFSGKSAMLLGLLKDYNKLGKIPKIRIIVIYTADVLRGTTRSETDMYSLTFTLAEAFLSELNCSTVRRTIEEIVNTEQDVTSEEMMQDRLWRYLC